jgi:hypothetical protein
LDKYLRQVKWFAFAFHLSTQLLYLRYTIPPISGFYSFWVKDDRKVVCYLKHLLLLRYGLQYGHQSNVDSSEILNPAAWSKVL